MNEKLEEEIAKYLLIYVAKHGNDLNDCRTYAQDIINMIKKRIELAL